MINSYRKRLTEYFNREPTRRVYKRNNRDGTFTDIIDQMWNAFAFADTHGVAWADFDNDGDQDLITLCGVGGVNCLRLLRKIGALLQHRFKNIKLY